ncbi:PKD domain-containing protein, partial [[Eubacterium] cellulosolvens]
MVHVKDAGQRTYKMKGEKSTNRLPGASRAHALKMLAVALYITFLILSAIPFLADEVIVPDMKDSYEYHLTYRKDGRQSHYYVERVETDKYGYIDLEYFTATNLLEVKTRNIEVLHIFCRSMYEDECEKVYGFDPAENSNYYKWYFIEKNHLTVKIDSEYKIRELSFIDTPIPYQVIVNSLRWYEGRQYNYTDNYATALSNVPKGQTHVDIFFKANDNSKPIAKFTADKTIVNINTLVNFDASASFDVDGEIIAYIWDFGDGQNSGGVINAHSWTAPGVYCVILTVRDDNFLIDHAYMNITVVQGTNKPLINGVVPNQQKPEDSPPWELDLSSYGIDLDSSPSELRWYLTGENTNLYQILGENSTGQKLIFSLLENANGDDLVTLWLTDKDGYNSSQSLWINITPVNDKPVIATLPNIIVHYGVPYKFLLSHYISDIETPKEQLMVTA